MYLSLLAFRVSNDRRAMAESALARVEKSRLINNQIFAYYRVRPRKTKRQKLNPQSFKLHQEMLLRIAPWLPRRVPKWMRAVT